MVVIKRADISFPYLEGGIKRGLSNSRIYESIRGTPVGRRKVDVYDTLRFLRGHKKKRATIRAVGKDRRPSWRVMPKAYFKQTDPYLFGGRVRGRDKRTGEIYYKPVKKGMFELATIREIEEELMWISETWYFEPLEGIIEEATRR